MGIIRRLDDVGNVKLDIWETCLGLAWSDLWTLVLCVKGSIWGGINLFFVFGYILSSATNVLKFREIYFALGRRSTSNQSMARIKCPIPTRLLSQMTSPRTPKSSSSKEP
jgi:hypothetical protein